MSVRDWHIYGGLLLATVGGWQLSPGATLAVVGVALMWIGIYAPGPRAAGKAKE